MRLEKSKYLALPETEQNNWREILLSEDMLISALTSVLSTQTLRVLKRNERIERVIVGEPANGVYPLSIAIIKGKEV